MRIVVVGCGNVGFTLIEELVKEGHQITAIDTDPTRVREVVDKYDVMGYVGNGASSELLREVGIDNTQLLIAITASDETNILCCLIGKKLGNCHTIARVRSPQYTHDVDLLKDELGLSLSINPELAAANAIARMLKFPSAMKVSTFVKGRVEVVTFSIDKESALSGLYLKDIPSRIKTETLIFAVERHGQIIIPDGNFQLMTGDKISIVADNNNTVNFLQRASRKFKDITKVMIVGGGSTGYYLAKELLATGIQVKIIEQNRSRCIELCDLLPNATIINGDGTDRHLLLEEGIESMDAFVSMTKIDEENMMLSLYANTIKDLKVITRVHRPNYVDMVETLNVGSVVYPRFEAAEIIASYVRAMNNSINSNVEALHRLLNDRVEALEFWIKESSAVTGIPLKDLNTKENVLIACINHEGNIIIPGGQNTIEVGDSVIITSTIQGLNDITDILR